jgi:hypothetical protein
MIDSRPVVPGAMVVSGGENRRVIWACAGTLPTTKTKTTAAKTNFTLCKSSPSFSESLNK